MIKRIKHFLAIRRGLETIPNDPREAARTLALAGAKAQRKRIRATCDEMRANMGLPKVTWPQ